MTCTDIRELLPLHAYGDLATEQAGAVAGHLRDCPACRAEATALVRKKLRVDDRCFERTSLGKQTGTRFEYRKSNSARYRCRCFSLQC